MQSDCSEEARKERRRLANLANAKRWYAEHREQALEYKRRWRAANRERLTAYDAARLNAPDRVQRRRAATARWEERNPERMRLMARAHWLVRKAISHGVLVRPDTCEECGATGRRITGAHFDYARPLDVRWLCSPCHSRWDWHEPKSAK